MFTERQAKTTIESKCTNKKYWWFAKENGIEEKNNIPERNGQCLINQREKGG